MRIAISLLLAGIVLVGCSPSQPYVTPDRLQRGLVVVLPGIEGRGLLNENICRGLVDGGVNWAVEIQDWTSNWGPLYNLRAEGRNRQKAKQIVHRVSQYSQKYPDRPVILLGQSGGGAMAVWVAEAMDRSDCIKGLVLINASLSREYDLDKALRNTDQGIVNYYSGHDWVLLGVGTTVYGTMDGEHAVSAGMEGFWTPSDLPDSYDRLYQIGWTKKMAHSGHGGGHLSSGGAKFVARYVAPLVRAETWSKALVEEIQVHDPSRTIDSPSKTPGLAPEDPAGGTPIVPVQ
jgi:pimeloyl-ACP methyl ester carboxylesterase